MPEHQQGGRACGELGALGAALGHLCPGWAENPMTQPLDAYPNLLDGTPAPLRPYDVEPLNEDDIAHIVWEHGWGFGGFGKTLFPAGWSHEVIRSTVEAALWSEGPPRRLSRTPAGVIIRAWLEGLIIALPLMEFDHSWGLMTAYPLCSEGVTRNISGQGRVPVPLNLDELTRTLEP